METNPDQTIDLRDRIIMLYSHLVAEQLTSATLTSVLNQGKTLSNAKETLERVLDDQNYIIRNYHLHKILPDATAAEHNLVLHDYVPMVLKDHIELLEELIASEQEAIDKVSETIINRKKQIGFAP